MTDEQPCAAPAAPTWDHYIKPEHARQLRAQADSWRAEHDHVEGAGYVVIFEREVVGWTSVLKKKDGWRAGCIAVPSTADASFFIAVGGNKQDGAENWEVLDIREEAKRRQSAPAPAPTRTPKTARQELIALVTWALHNRYCSTAETIRALLLSLYNGSENKCDLAGVQLLDSSQRRSLAAVIIGIGRDGIGNFYDHEIRETFAIVGGEKGLIWFLGDLEDSLLRHFMSGAKRAAERQVAA
jgi:hypothetical protein